jgi:hypothetical protein
MLGAPTGPLIRATGRSGRGAVADARLRVVRQSKTLLRAEELAGEPLDGFLLGSRIHPLVAALPTAVFAIALVSASILVLLPATLVLFTGLYLLLGRSVAITRREALVLVNRPPLWRPGKVKERYARGEAVVTKKRRLWRVTLGPETYFVNKAFEPQVRMLAGLRDDEDPSARAARKSRRPAASTPKRTTESRRITPKGTPPRGRRR